MTEGIRERLRSHPGLIVSGGKLRARRPEWGPALKDAFARHLGVAPATARTHLSSVFEKTGVNSQSALVRILLSIG